MVKYSNNRIPESTNTFTHSACDAGFEPKVANTLGSARQMVSFLGECEECKGVQDKWFLFWGVRGVQGSARQMVSFLGSARSARECKGVQDKWFFGGSEGGVRGTNEFF